MAYSNHPDPIRAVIANGLSCYDASEIHLSNANGVSFGINAETITASIAAGATATGNFGGVADEEGQTYTSGTLVFKDANGISFGLEPVLGQSLTATFAAIKSVSAGTTRATNGEVILSNSNGVSFGMNAGTLTGSVAAGATATGNLGAIAGGTQTATSGTIVFSDSNQISFGLSGSTRMTATFAAIKSVSAGTTRATNGEVIFSNSNGVSFGMDAGTVTASVAAGPAAGIGAIAGGTQTATSGTIVFSDSNQISFGLSGSTRMTATFAAIKSISAGTTRVTNDEIIFSNSNGVSFGIDGGTATGSVAAGATATGNLGALAAGTQTATSGTIVFSDSNGISFGLSGSTRVTASFNAIKSISAGTTRLTSGEAIFSDSNGISFGVDGNTVTASHDGLRSVQDSATTLNVSKLVFSNSNGVTFGLSTAAGVATVTASVAAGAAPTLSFWQNLELGGTGAVAYGDQSLHLWPLMRADMFPGNMTVNTLFLNLSCSVSTGAPFTRSFSIGFYTLVNSTQISLAFSASTSFGTNAANMNINDSFGGWRWVTFHSSQFNAQPVFSQTQYWLALWNRSSSGTQTFSPLAMGTFFFTTARSGFISVVSNSATSQKEYPFLGVRSAGFSTAMPASIHASDIAKNVGNVMSVPHLIFNNVGSNIV